MTILDKYDVLNNYGVIKATFGDIGRFLLNYNLSYSSEYELYKLLQFPNIDVHIINNNKLGFNLVKYKAGVIDIDSILLDEPYVVSNMRGEVLYKVSEHVGYFGRSNYDKYLITNSGVIGLYLLEYPTHSGYKIKVLIVDNTYDILPKLEFKPNLNTEVNLENVTRNSNSIHINSDSYFEVFYLNKPITNFISVNLIENNPDTEIYNSDKFLTFIPKESGWIIFKKDGLYVTYNSINGNGLDRLIQIDSIDPIYYVFIGNSFNKSYLNRLKGYSTFSKASIQAKINL